MRDQNLQVLEYLIVAGIHSTISAIRMLAFPKTGVSDSYDLSELP